MIAAWDALVFPPNNRLNVNIVWYELTITLGHHRSGCIITGDYIWLRLRDRLSNLANPRSCVHVNWQTGKMAPLQCFAFFLELNTSDSRISRNTCGSFGRSKVQIWQLILALPIMQVMMNHIQITPRPSHLQAPQFRGNHTWLKKLFSSLSVRITWYTNKKNTVSILKLMQWK